MALLLAICCTLSVRVQVRAGKLAGGACGMAVASREAGSGHPDLPCRSAEPAGAVKRRPSGSAAGRREAGRLTDLGRRSDRSLGARPGGGGVLSSAAVACWAGFGLGADRWSGGPPVVGA